MKSPFSAGRLYGQRTDIASQVPLEFGVLQSCSIEFDYTTKSLTGKNQFPVFVARGAGKLPVKAQVGIFSGKLFNEIFFGQALTSGQIAAALDEAHNVPAASTYTVTATNSATFSSDEGVVYASNGAPLTLTSALSASGQYTVAAGTYTFSSGDASAAVQVNYLYTTTSGQQIPITNQNMGVTPYFKGVFRNYDPSTGLFTTLVIDRLTASKLTLNAKMNDFQLADFEMEAMDDGTGNIGTLSFGDAN